MYLTIFPSSACSFAGHSIAETVDLSVYSISIGVGIRRLASTAFQYVADSAHQMATFLSACINEPGRLADLLGREEHFHLSDQEQFALDERLTRAFQALKLPEWWNMMGTVSEGMYSYSTHFQIN